jgi:hypothetical protein
MPRIKLESIVDHLDREFKKVLEETVKKFSPGVEADRNVIFKEFKKELSKYCNAWESVPENYIERD